jgi:plasmid maintenance system antidote protein VapI
MAENDFAPVTPGEMLKEEFLAAYRLSQSQLCEGYRNFPEPHRRDS